MQPSYPITDSVRGAKETLWSLPFASGHWGVGKFQMEGVDEVAKKLTYAGMTKKFYKEMMAQVNRWKKGAGARRGSVSPWKAFADQRAEVLKSLRLEGNSFTITRGDATLKGTFAAPGNVKLSTDDMETMKMGAKRTILYDACAGLFAKGADDYFCVMTVQRGDAPRVTVRGRGLDAVVTVGGQTVRFDGEKIVFGR